ncbi:hypothetical protein REIFOR_01177 [Reinekea forsetii]|uniref:Uncharacterized protein n=1 Tax=Reinekea forsetii TaxID=1336806 RepID=A0A2K8KNC8_9GAMM|nr:hypothetical protein REIFOR_01177 [Reinekea forsetii]
MSQIAFTGVTGDVVAAEPTAGIEAVTIEAFDAAVPGEHPVHRWDGRMDQQAMKFPAQTTVDGQAGKTAGSIGDQTLGFIA